MRKKQNWWWVVVTLERGSVKRKEAIKLGMIFFMNHSAAAKVFDGKRIAVAWINEVKQKALIPEGIKLHILSNEAWYFARDMYYIGRRFRQGQL